MINYAVFLSQVVWICEIAVIDSKLFPQNPSNVTSKSDKIFIMMMVKKYVPFFNVNHYYLELFLVLFL